jgi:hypothetical protein
MRQSFHRLTLIVLFSLPAACVSTAPASVAWTENPTRTIRPGPTTDLTTVWVFFTMAGDENMTPVPVARTVRNSEDPNRLVVEAMGKLFYGPSDAEKEAGFTSWFHPAASFGWSIEVREDGDFTVDFQDLDDLIPNASTSAGSRMLLSQLNSTLFQFEVVQTVHYTLRGDCAAFWEWLQMDCHPVTRVEWEAG